MLSNRENERVLVVGRSPSVLLDAIDILRAKGYSAEATNQFDTVLDDYDVAEVDVVVFGGMVPPDTKQYLRTEVSRRNPRVTFIQGLAGIAGLIAAQVEAVSSADRAVGRQVSYDAQHRAVSLTMAEPAQVTVDAWWITSLKPPEPKSASIQVFAGTLEPGLHLISLPVEVPNEASFATVTVDSMVHVLTVGAVPRAITRLVSTSTSDIQLPPVNRVTTGARVPHDQHRQ